MLITQLVRFIKMAGGSMVMMTCATLLAFLVCQLINAPPDLSWGVLVAAGMWDAACLAGVIIAGSLWFALCEINGALRMMGEIFEMVSEFMGHVSTAARFIGAAFTHTASAMYATCWGAAVQTTHDPPDLLAKMRRRDELLDELMHLEAELPFRGPHR
jgi:hypothetical protein